MNTHNLFTELMLWLTQSAPKPDAGALTLLVDPLLRGLHDDPRYKNLSAKLGLPKLHE